MSDLEALPKGCEVAQLLALQLSADLFEKSDRLRRIQSLPAAQTDFGADHHDGGVPAPFEQFSRPLSPRVHHRRQDTCQKGAAVPGSSFSPDTIVDPTLWGGAIDRDQHRPPIHQIVGPHAVYRFAREILAEDQTTGVRPVVWVVLDDLTLQHAEENLVEGQAVSLRLLVRVIRDAHKALFNGIDDVPDVQRPIL